MRQMRLGASATTKDVATAMETRPPNVRRLELENSLNRASVATVRRFLAAAGYELRLVAVPSSGRGASVEIVEPHDADNPTDAS